MNDKVTKRKNVHSCSVEWACDFRLGGHVVDVTGGDRLCNKLRVIKHLRNAEVGNFGTEIGRKEDVGCGEVTMYNGRSLAVEIEKAVGHVQQNRGLDRYRDIWACSNERRYVSI